MSDELAVDFGKVIQAHVFWVGALFLLIRLL
jgi:hypothetical protein